ncbi:T9SS type A sorting domain-containing protein [Carboxylicivirga sp. RSCT41]|uniref:T9SS type A sorting domain-containing protein n=1 Tax=Carboxylicivirga agarovorans TaxID=3417570 RepID=UPI003D3285FA
MKKLLFLFLLSFCMWPVSWAQVVTPTQNSDLLSTSAGQVTEVKPFSDGIIYILNTGSNDVISYSLNGVDFQDSETLENGSASRLAAWVGNNMAFYYGNNTSDAGEVDLRVNNSGTASLLLSSGHPASNPATTNVLHADFGSGNEWYYYMAKGEWDDLKGQEAILYESDGTDMGTFEAGQDVGFLKKIRMSEQNQAGVLEGTVYGNAFYFIADMEGGGSGNYSSIFKVDYDAMGGTATLVVNSGSETHAWGNLMVTDENYYVTKVAIGGESLPMDIISKSNTSVINSITQPNFHNETPVQSNNRIYAVGDPIINGAKIDLRKLTVINGLNDVLVMNMNAEDESDEINNLTLSGNKLFFTATPTGGTQGIYAIRTDVEDPEFVLVDDLGGKELRAMIAVPEGIAYAVWDEPIATGTPSGNVVISQGFTDADYWLHRGGTHGNFSWDKVTDLVVNGNTLFVLEEADNGTDVNIWSHDLTQSEFAKASVQFTITDSETSAVIANANLMLDNGLESYDLTTNASGQAVILDIPQGWYNYELSASGYNSITDSRIWMGAGASEKTLTMEADDATSINKTEEVTIQVYPNPTNGLLHVKSDIEVVTAEVFDMTGRCVKIINAESIQQIDLSDLPKGLYMVVLNDSIRQTKTVKITKR